MTRSKNDRLNVVHAAKWGLAVLTLINLLNYTDRYVVAALIESLKGSELHLNDMQAGSLMSSFIVVYMLISPLFGMLGDRYSRVRLIAFGVGVWSFATALGGFARSYLALFLSRATVGVGEAAYGTIAPTLLSDYFPKSQRGRVFAIFFSAIPIGSALGYLLGGYVDQHFGWRAAFFIAGLPGLALAGLVLGLYEPERGIQDEKEAHAPEHPATPRQAYAELWKNKPYVQIILGYAAYTFALGGLAFWMPTFLERIRGVPKSTATVQFGIIIVITGFLGTFIGGWLGDYFLRRTRQAYLWVSGLATLAALPFAFLALASPEPHVYLAATVLAEIFLFISTGPINSAIVNVVSPQIRATAMAACTFSIHFLGDVPSPLLIGAISDASSLRHAVMIVPVAIFISGFIWTYAAWRFRHLST